MIRTQISLEKNDHLALKRNAAEKDIYLAELIRRLVRDHLRAGSTKKRFEKEDYLVIAGMGASGQRDVSVHHDKYVGMK